MLKIWAQKLNLPYLFANGLTFLLGASVADYLGHPTVLWKTLLGILTVWVILAASHVIFEYFTQVNAGAQPFSKYKDKIDQGMPSPQTILTIAIVLLTLAVAIGFSLIKSSVNGGLTVVLLVIILLSAALFIGQPHLAFSGYGELIRGMICCGLVPALAYSILAEGIHPLLLTVTFPLIFIFMAVNLALGFNNYASDLKHEQRSLLIRLGWQRGVGFHHVLLLVGFILLTSTPLLGVAWRLIWPALLSLVIAIFEIWLINRIALGYPPRWPLLKLTAWLAFILPVYLLTITFWMA